jgi:opacity protein-like surface antigen
MAAPFEEHALLLPFRKREMEGEREAAMSARHVLGVGLVFGLLFVGLPAAAQTPQHGYVVGLGGVGATEVTSPFFGASVGFNVTPDLVITGEFSRSQDVLSGFTEEDLALADQGMEAVTGLASASKVKMPTNFLTAGIKYLIPASSVVRPYVTGTAGLAFMRPEPTFTWAGFDMTSDVMVEPYMQTVFRDETRPVATVGGGVAVTVARHVTVDTGYMFSGIFIDEDYLQDYEVSPHSHSQIYTHRVHVGLGFSF